MAHRLAARAGPGAARERAVQLAWHSVDLSVARFSARPEVVSFGVWAGDDRIPAAAFPYTAPEPLGPTGRAPARDAVGWDIDDFAARRG